MKTIRLTLCPVFAKPIPRFSFALLVATLPIVALAARKDVSYSNAPSQVEAYDYAEVSATLSFPDARNPFTDATLSGRLEAEDGSQHWNVDGYCDSADGS